MVSVIVEVEWCCLRESPSYGSRSFDSQAQGRARKQIKGIAVDQDFFSLGGINELCVQFSKHQAILFIRLGLRKMKCSKGNGFTLSYMR